MASSICAFAVGVQRRAPVAAVRDTRVMEASEPDLVVVGDRVALGPLRRDLAADYARWANQLDVRLGLDFRGVSTARDQETWVDENLERSAKSQPDRVEFTIYDRSDLVPVGTAGL